MQRDFFLNESFTLNTKMSCHVYCLFLISVHFTVHISFVFEAGWLSTELGTNVLNVLKLMHTTRNLKPGHLKNRPCKFVS